MRDLIKALNDPDVTCVYFAAAVRGRLGDRASLADMDLNITTALQVAGWLRGKFPQVTWIVPHEHEIIIREAYLDGIPGDRIVSWWLKVSSECDGLVAYAPEDHLSSGVLAEVESSPCSVVISTTGEQAEFEVGSMLQGLRYK